MGLTDIIKPQICELGKIKIGGKGKERKSQYGNPFRPPEKYDHFIITTLQRDQAGDLILDKQLMESLRTEGYADPDGLLRRIPITLMSNDLEDIIQTSYVWYEGKRVAGRSDGKTTWIWHDRKTNQWLDEPRTTPWSDKIASLTGGKNNAPLFKQHTVFNCTIRSQSSRWGGVYKFRTTSVISASQLLGSLMSIADLVGGQIAGMPMQLAVRPVIVSPNGATNTVYVVHVELVGADILALRNQALQLAQSELTTRKKIESIRVQYRQLLAPPGHESDPDEIEEIEAEFSPKHPDDAIEPGRTVEPAEEIEPGDVPAHTSTRLRNLVADEPDEPETPYQIELENQNEPG